MGELLRFPFPNGPECPPHDWVSIYDEVDGFDEEIITGKVCMKCSLIETKETLAMMLAAIHGPERGQLGRSGSHGQSLFCIIPTFDA